MYSHQSPRFINTYANPPSQPEFEVQHPITDLSFVYAPANALDSGRGSQLAHPGQNPQLQEQQNDWAQQQQSFGSDSCQWGSSGPIYYEGSLGTQGIGLGRGDGHSSYQQAVPLRVSPFQIWRFFVKIFVLIQTYLRRACIQLSLRARKIVQAARVPETKCVHMRVPRKESMRNGGRF